MQEWIDAILTWEWLLGFSMALAFKNLGKVVSARLTTWADPSNSDE